MLELQPGGSLELVGQGLHARGLRRRAPPARRDRGDDPGERRGAEQHVGELGDRDPAQHLVDHRLQLVGPGRVGHAGDRRRDLGVGPAGVELVRHADRVGVHPLAQQVEPPQAAGQRVGGRARPQLGDGLDALGLGEVEQPFADGLLVGSRARPRTMIVAARSAASATAAGSAPASIASKNRSPGVIGRWWGRSRHGSRLRRGLDRIGQRLADALVADGVRRAEVLGPQRDAVLLQHPPHPAQRRPGRATHGQCRHLVEVGLLHVGDLRHQLGVARHLAVEPLAAVVDSGEVRRVAAQLVGSGLAHEAATHQPRDLRAHVLHGGQGEQLGAAADALLRLPPARRAPAARLTETAASRSSTTASSSLASAANACSSRAGSLRVDHRAGDRGAHVVDELGHGRVRRPGQPQLGGVVEPGERVDGPHPQQQQAA